jgi:phosphosulfolactate phosphohydrolase-like enzyme
LRPVIEQSDVVRIARRVYSTVRNDLLNALRESQGGQNVLAVNLGPDIEWAAAIDRFDVVGQVRGEPPIVVRVESAALA